MAFYQRAKKFLYIILLIGLAITFFTRNNYRKVQNIDSVVLKEPVQENLSDHDLIEFEKDDFKYELTPLYEYEISALVVHKMDYRIFSIYKTDSVFPMDLCMLWGKNVEDKIYQDKALSFSQDMRFCFARWTRDLNFNTDEISNTHLVIKDADLRKKINQISVGDQVRIKGKLVNVEAKNLGSPGKYDPANLSLNSSTTREDSGAGACEIIYVEELDILQKGNPVSYYLFIASLYVLIALIVIDILLFFLPDKNEKTF